MRLIDADALIDALDSFILDETTDIHGDTVREILERLPTIERKTGKWLKAYGDHEAFGIRPFYRYCSECNESTVWAYNFCPHCGADMRGE